MAQTSPQLTQGHIRSLAEILGSTDNGCTGSELGRLPVCRCTAASWRARTAAPRLALTCRAPLGRMLRGAGHEKLPSTSDGASPLTI